MPDFTRYQPPGVYIEEDLTALVTVVGLQPTVVAIVGPGRGYQLATETVSFQVDTDVDLINSVVDESTVVVKAADGTVYTVTDDYTLDTVGEITTITWVPTGEIPSGGTVFVSYRYTPEGYYAPLRVTDFDDVQAAYGPPVDLETGEIFSPISFAARLALQNGATELVLVATAGNLGPDPVTLEDLTQGYDQLLTQFDVDIIVPLPVGITGTEAAPGDTQAVGTDLRQHLLAAEAESLPRIGILGYESTALISPITTANAIENRRVVLAWPQVLRYYDGYTNTMYDVSGYYLAAAYAGILAQNVVQMPLTKKTVAGFAGLNAATIQLMTTAVKNAWSSEGVAVSELTRDNVLEVRHGVTTETANINTREISLVRAKDALITLVKGTVEGADLIGSWIEEETPGRVKSVVAGALEAAVDSGIIYAYNDLKARQLTSDPSVIEVKFQYRPSYPLNYIVIKFSINTETGEVITTEEEAA